jgi:tRNA pseudouridine38-40 synthase
VNEVTSEERNSEAREPGSDVGQMVRTVVEYDGTQYFGFQIQTNAPTIQGELEAALLRITGAPIRIVGGGRTDTGVHAAGQGVSFRVSWKHPLEDLLRAMNAHLPQDIAVKEIVAASEGVHARFSAVGRRYRYSLFGSPVRSPLLERFAWRLAAEPDLKALNAASRLLVGEKDFGAFGEAPSGNNTVRCIRSAVWSRHGPLLVWDVEANAFLHRMVRRLVGTMVWVATGRMSFEDLSHLLSTPDRSQVAPPAPASGLCLMEVLY